MAARDDDLPYRIEVWDAADTRVEEPIALVSDYASACGTFEEVIKRRPGKLITLRQKARVIKEESRGGSVTAN